MRVQGSVQQGGRINTSACKWNVPLHPGPGHVPQLFTSSSSPATLLLQS